MKNKFEELGYQRVTTAEMFTNCRKYINDGNGFNFDLTNKTLSIVKVQDKKTSRVTLSFEELEAILEVYKSCAFCANEMC